jgi:putative endopeptidase
MHGFNLDNSIEPHDDFFLHVNNIWINNNDIPDDKTSWNAFNELHEENYNKIKELLSGDTNDPEFNKALILHKQALAQQAIAMQTLSIKPYIPIDMINHIKQCNTMEELRRAVIDRFSLYNIIQVHNFNVSSDMNNSNMNILHLFSGGLGLPDRDYYFNNNRSNLLQEYKSFMQRYMDLFKDYTNFDVDNVFNVELFLAEHTYTSVQKRDATIMNNVHNLEDISILCNELYNDISYFLSRINYPISNLPVNLTNPKFTLAYYKLLNNVDLETMKQFFIYLYLRKMGTYISMEAEEILFDFNCKTLSGMKSMQPVWKRAINVVESNLSMILGKMYVAKYFDETKKQQMLRLVKYIMDEFRDRLETNEWMTPETKNRALEKLAKMNVKVGYPDKWIDYSELNVTETNSYFQNILNCFRMDFLLEIKDIYKQVDKTKWFMSPYEINAYYSPEFNEIVFPAGILQEPFFGNDMAKNFGGIGCIVGHEITHGFDDMGRMFDADGNLRDWWQEEDSIKYKEKTNILKEMYDNLTIEGEKVNGSLTLGENIADLGGVEISLRAMRRFFGNNNKDAIFFYNYANIWRCKIRKEEIIKRLMSDPHSPACFRVNTILSNVDAFYDIFNINNNTKIWLEPSKRARIW